jgi:hypothetical protein
VGTAVSFFLLSGISLILLLRPGGRFVLAADEIRVVMEVEGIALFFSLFLSMGIIGMFKSKAAKSRELSKGEMAPLPALLLFFFMGFVVGGGMVAAVGGLKSAVAYWIVLLLHVHGSIRLSEREMRLDGGVNGWGLFAFVGLGILATWARIFPSFGKYPSFDKFWGFDLEGNQMLGWACCHFALIGYLCLNKERIFGHLVDWQMEAEQKQLEQKR